jgi:DNA-binding transcriptional MerR regulator
MRRPGSSGMTGATLTVSRGTGVSHQVLQAAVLSEAGVNKYYTITELTREFGISTRTLRFYEDEGLIHPERRGRTRLFRSADRRLIMEILRGRRIGFTIAEIREIIQVYKDPPGEAGQLRLLMKRVEEKREELQQKRKDIEETLEELGNVEEACLTRLAEIGVGT